MQCAWKELLSILPKWMVPEVDELDKGALQELRLRIGKPPQLVLNGKLTTLKGKVTADDLNFCVNTASRYSPWAMSTVSQGYLTAPGGNRIGLCGETVVRNGCVEGIKNLTSLCIRVARDFPGIGSDIPTTGSILILGAPGWGKTTLLRDLIRNRSDTGQQISVVDERGELFPSGFATGQCTDILTGCPKPEGIDMLLRTMGPSCIAVDEITEEKDCHALTKAAGCGVTLLATAHAASIKDLERRSVYRKLLETKIFDNVVVLRSDKSWRLERVGL